MKDGDRAIRVGSHGLLVAVLAKDAREPSLVQLRSQDDGDAALKRYQWRYASQDNVRSVKGEDQEARPRLPPLPQQQQQQRIRLDPPRSTTRQRTFGCVARAGSIIAQRAPRTGGRTQRLGAWTSPVSTSSCRTFTCREGDASDPDQLLRS
jgi:hypothetical protein